MTKEEVLKDVDTTSMMVAHIDYSTINIIKKHIGYSYIISHVSFQQAVDVFSILMSYKQQIEISEFAINRLLFIAHDDLPVRYDTFTEAMKLTSYYIVNRSGENELNIINIYEKVLEIGRSYDTKNGRYAFVHCNDEVTHMHDIISRTAYAITKYIQLVLINIPDTSVTWRMMYWLMMDIAEANGGILEEIKVQAVRILRTNG